MTTSNSANTKQSNNASQKRKPIHNGYFNHPTSSSSNIPMSILIREQGLEIYGLYWVMLEEAHAQLKCCVNIQTMGIIANIFHAQPEHLELLYHHYFRRPGKGYNSHILYADFCEESAIRSYFPQGSVYFSRSGVEHTASETIFQYVFGEVQCCGTVHVTSYI